MSRVLLTGASGFIGRQALAPLVERGFEVHAVARSDGPAVPGVRWHRCDLLAPGAAAGLAQRVRADALLHLAWTTEHGTYWSDPANLDWLAASARLVAAFRRAGGERVVVAGTCAEYDWARLDDAPCHETRTAIGPHTLYGTAKHALHLALAAHAAESGYALAWGRLFHLFGPHEDPRRLVPAVIGALAAGRPARTASGRPLRDLMDVRDAAAGLVALLASEVRGPVNVASGEPVRLSDLVRRLGELCARPELVRIGALPDRPDDPGVLVADTVRLRQEVGFVPGWKRDDALRERVERHVQTEGGWG